MDSMTSATDIKLTNLPSWQTTPCPPWCRWAPHGEDEMPEDRHHAGPTLRRALPLEKPARLCED